MNSQLALVLTNGSLDDWKRSPRLEGSTSRSAVEAVTPTDRASSGPPQANLQSPPSLASTGGAEPINGGEAKVGGTSTPASLEIGGPVVVKQRITVKTGVPVLRKEPIKIKIVVPSLSRTSITNSSVSCATKEPPNCDSSATSGTGNSALTAKMNTDTTPAGQIETTTTACAADQTSREPSLRISEKVGGEGGRRGSDVKEDESGHSERLTAPDGPVPSHTDPAKDPGQPGVREETIRGEIRSPLSWQAMDWKTVRRKEEAEGETGQGGGEEQTEAMDLSLPKRRERKERRCARVTSDSAWDSPLIMEVDEVEGEVDRDVVEEDDPEEGPFYADPPLLSPSFFSTSIFTSLSSIESDTEDLLLIDDQGIPYTLTPDGHKLPQIDCSKIGDPHPAQQVVQSDSGRELSRLSPSGSSLSKDSDTTPHTPIAPCGGLSQPPAPAAAPAQEVALSQTAELFFNSEPTLGPGGDTTPGSTQPIQILTGPASNTPIFLLSASASSHLSSAPLSLSLPLSLGPNASSASPQMFLLLSSPASSTGHSFSPSGALAVLDPSTGQLSHITTASSAVSLPLPQGQVNLLGTPLPSAPSHPVIRLSPNSTPMVLSTVSNALVTPGPGLIPLSAPSSTPTQQSTVLLSSAGLPPALPDPADPQSEAGSTPQGEAQSDPSQAPSAHAETPPRPQSSGVTSDPPAADADQLVASDARFESSGTAAESLPLEDHLYFSSTTPPLSPPLGPGNLEPLDPLDPLDPGSPSSLGPRRVLYCQLCPRVFFYLSDLERHAITHSQNKPHVCQQCGKAFKRASHLQRHRHIHTGQRNYVCPICAKRFREAGELQRHQRVHTGEKPYQCQLCHIRFAERNTLRRHTKRKHPYHQVAMEMLSERRGGGSGGGMGGGGGGGGGGGEEEESAEWYSSTVSNLDDSDSES